MTSCWLKRSLLSRALDLRKALLLLQWQSAICPSLEVATTQDDTHTLTSEAYVVTSALKELLAQLEPTLIGATSLPPSTSKGIPNEVVEIGSMSVPAQPEPILDILESLVLHMID